MFNVLVGASLRQRLLVLAVAVLLMVYGSMTLVSSAIAASVFTSRKSMGHGHRGE